MLECHERFRPSGTDEPMLWPIILPIQITSLILVFLIVVVTVAAVAKKRKPGYASHKAAIGAPNSTIMIPKDLSCVVMTTTKLMIPSNRNNPLSSQGAREPNRTHIASNNRCNAAPKASVKNRFDSSIPRKVGTSIQLKPVTTRTSQGQMRMGF